MEAREGVAQLLMQRRRRERRIECRPAAILPCGGARTLDQFVIAGKPKIIVRRQQDHRATVEFGTRPYPSAEIGLFARA